MKLAVLKETHTGETRCAATPETVKKLINLGFSVAIETGAGTGAFLADNLFEQAGASTCPTAQAALKEDAVVLKLRPPYDTELAAMKSGTVLIGLLEPYKDRDRLEKYAQAGVEAFSMEFCPRISRAQTMDVLSSQANLAGYKAVIDAAATFAKAMPMMMTAAGTVAPARVMVLGAGVAGLQAIATARRLGAVVCATDVRPAAKEQVESLGATFVMVDSEEMKQAETSGGYAKEMSEDFKRKQAALVAETVQKQDIVICTALIPGRPAPLLVSEDMVGSMKPGSVIVDMAVEQGGNCALSKCGETVRTPGGVTILGHANMPGRLPVDATALYARNLLHFLTPLVKDGALHINHEDEIVTGTALTHGGAVVHPMFVKEGA